MARLPSLKPALAKMPARLTAEGLGETRTVFRRRASPWRKWYSTARWQRLRWQVLTEAMFTCAMCGRLVADTSKLVADHKVPHRGDEALFWDASNIQCLCKPCHDRVKQREERQGIHLGDWIR